MCLWVWTGIWGRGQWFHMSRFMWTWTAQCHSGQGDVREDSRHPLFYGLYSLPQLAPRVVTSLPLAGVAMPVFSKDFWDVTLKHQCPLPIDVLISNQCDNMVFSFILSHREQGMDTSCMNRTTFLTVHTPLSCASHCWCCVESRRVANVEINSISEM